MGNQRNRQVTKKRNKKSKANKRAWANQRKRYPLFEDVNNIVNDDIIGCSTSVQNVKTDNMVEAEMELNIRQTKEQNKKAKASKIAWTNQIKACPLFVDVNNIVNDDIGCSTSVQNVKVHNMIETESEMELNNRLANRRVYPSASKIRNLPNFQSSDMLSTPENQKIMDEEPNNPPVFSGNRIVELRYVLDWAINLQYEHSKVCSYGKLYVHKEIRRNEGLNSFIIFKCTQCDATIMNETEPPKSRLK